MKIFMTSKQYRRFLIHKLRRNLGFQKQSVYFIGTATSFGLGILGLLKALVWPVFLVWGALKYLGL